LKTSLLASKMRFPPGRPILVPRPRLIERLLAGLKGCLTLISAPAGSGKTTLLAEWHLGSGANTPAAWLTLDEEDNEPARFYRYLFKALDPLQPGLAGEMEDLLSSSDTSSPEAILTPFVNSLSQVYPDFVLILDDYQHIENQLIHKAMQFLLEHMPELMHLVILTRADPPLPLSRLRARSQLVEIRAEHLQFSHEEAALFLNQVCGLRLTQDQVLALGIRTEGWIAGLQMAALSMRDRKDVDHFVETLSGSNRYIGDYLVEEVLDREPKTRRDFLLRTSILTMLNGSLCNSLTGREDGAVTLESLDRANMFLIPMDEERRWFRYHPLFADLLHSRLLQQPELEAELHRKASQWFAANHRLDEALKHTLATRDFQQAMDIMEVTFPDAYVDDRILKILSWGNALPPGLLYQHPALCVYYAWAVVTMGAYADAEETLTLPAMPLDAAAQEAILPVVRSHGKDQVIRLLEFVQQAMAAPLPASLAAVMLTECQVFILWHLGEIKKAAVMAKENVRLAQLQGILPGQTLGARVLARILVAQARLREAFQINQSMIDDPRNSEKLLVLCQAFYSQGNLYYEWNQLSQAAEMALKGLEFSRRAKKFDAQISFLRLVARIHQAQGNYPAAHQALDEAVLIGRDFAKVQIFNDLIAASQARLSLAEGDLPSAQAWLSQVKTMIGANPHLVTIPLEGAMIALAKGQKQEAFLTLQERYRAAEENEVLYAQIEIRLWQALAGENERVKQRCVEEALIWAEPQGMVRLFLDVGPALLPLLQKALLRKITPDYTNRLLAAFTALPSVRAEKTSSVLSSRELELLRLLAVGCSNKEIATKLVISLGTVKRHTVNIYTKLDVKNRTEAVARAREIKLL
jgi:LuxR family transcriptional regulator, maltose regulon positive regulatory protein